VIALRERPGVPARNGAEVEEGAAAEATLVWSVRHVSLERHAVPAGVEEAEGARREPIDPVCPDHHRRTRGSSAETDRGAALLELECGCAHAVANVGAGRGRLLDQVRVEAAPLRHQHERPVAAPALEAAAVAETELDELHHVLDDGIHRHGQLPHRAVGQPATAGFVAREALTVEQQHARARAREAKGGRRAGGAGPDHDRIEPLHAA